jgi:O-succinylbenzoic acid--CoA ligase
VEYSHSTVLLNNRQVKVSDLLEGNVKSYTTHEDAALEFMREWLLGKDAFTIHTSGSTGEPKPIRIRREQMKQSAQRTLNALGIKPNDTALIALPVHYIAGKMMMVRALESNLRIIVVDPSSNPLEKLDEELIIDFTAFVPLQLQTLLENASSFRQLNKMKAILVGGGAVSENLKQEIQKLNVPVYATYGMTETISNVALQLLNTTHRDDYFTPLPDVKIETDERGCLVIHDALLYEPVVTNDLVEITREGKFRWAGRIDNVINSGGIKISPEQVENQVEKIFSDLQINRAFFIAGIPHEKLGEQVVLIIEGDPLDESIENRLRDSMNRSITHYSVPKTFLYVSQFVLTSTGKINRKETHKRALKD